MADEEQDLAGAAEDKLEGLDVEQEKLPGTNFSRVSFLGMAWETVDVPDLKEEVEFVVKGMVVEHGEKVYADGDVKPIAKVDVNGVIRVDTGTYAEHKREQHEEG